MAAAIPPAGPPGSARQMPWESARNEGESGELSLCGLVRKNPGFARSSAGGRMRPGGRPLLCRGTTRSADRPGKTHLNSDARNVCVRLAQGAKFCPFRIYTLEMAGDITAAKPGSQPDRHHVERGHNGDQKERGGEQHRRGGHAILAVKTEIVNVVTQVHEAPLQM